MIKRLPATTKKVCFQTDPKINAKIREQTVRSLEFYRDADENMVASRIRKLNGEWNTEKVLEVNAASVIILSSLIGLLRGRGYFLLTGLVSLFLLKHALEGWCPPLPIIRRMGIRTSEEIDHEKTVLKMMRGDFLHVDNTVESMLNTVEK